MQGIDFRAHLGMIVAENMSMEGQWQIGTPRLLCRKRMRSSVRSDFDGLVIYSRIRWFWAVVAISVCY